MAGIAYGAVQDYTPRAQMVVLGQPNDERNPLLGDIPTFAEQDVDFVMNNPYIIAFPKGTDAADRVADGRGDAADHRRSRNTPAILSRASVSRSASCRRKKAMSA